MRNEEIQLIITMMLVRMTSRFVNGLRGLKLKALLRIAFGGWMDFQIKHPPYFGELIDFKNEIITYIRFAKSCLWSFNLSTSCKMVFCPASILLSQQSINLSLAKHLPYLFFLTLNPLQKRSYFCWILHWNSFHSETVTPDKELILLLNISVWRKKIMFSILVSAGKAFFCFSFLVFCSLIHFYTDGTW